MLRDRVKSSQDFTFAPPLPRRGFSGKQFEGQRDMNTSSLEYHLAEFKIAVSPDDPRHLQPALQNDFASILDIGCCVGQGLLSLELNDHVFACGADIDEAALGHGKQLAPGIHFVCTEGERLPFGDLLFDFVMSRVALPYMHIPKAL